MHLNPDVDSYSETVSTLKFAQRVSGVDLGAGQTHREGRDIRELMEQVTIFSHCPLFPEVNVAYVLEPSSNC